MRFDELLEQVLDLLQRRGRVSYWVLKRQLDLDDAYLAVLKAEIIDVHRLAVDQDGTMLVWTGGVVIAPATDQVRGPVSTAAPHPGPPCAPGATAPQDQPNNQE